MSTTDEQLVSLVRRGDMAAFKVIFHQHSEKLCKWAWKITNDKQAAEDIVQEFFIYYWQNKETLFFRPSFLSYAYRAVYNSSLNFVRDNNKFVYATINHESLVEEPKHNEEEVLREALVMDAIGKLPPACKKIFYMAKFENKSYAEIAKQLNISENTVRTQVSKAFRLIRNSFIVILFLVFTFY